MVVKNMDLLLILIGKLHYFICEILRVLSSIQKSLLPLNAVLKTKLSLREAQLRILHLIIIN